MSQTSRSPNRRHALRIGWFLSAMLCVVPFAIGFMMPTLAQAAPRVYRWVDTDGNVRYSDRIPPDQSELGHSQIAPKTGIVEKEIPRAKTAEAQSREMAEEQERRRQEAIERAQREEERRLLRRYRDIDAIEQDQQVNLDKIDKEIEEVEMRVAGIQTSVTDLKKRAATLERQQSSPPTDLYARLDGLEQEIEEQEKLIASKQEEKKAVKEQFAQFREQFVKIMGEPTAK